MHATQAQAARRPPVVAGIVLVAIGISAFVFESVGVDIGHVIGEGGWPFFVVLPGLALLVAGFAIAPPRGIGFTIAGSVVTAVGLILLFQNITDAWESWAYVWALIPTAVGLGLLVYGAVYDERTLLRAGLRVGVVGAILFAVGRWYLGPVLENGQPPIVIGTGWPWLLVLGGLVLVGSALIGRGDGRDEVSGSGPGEEPK